MRTYNLQEFMDFPNMALRLAMKQPFRCRGIPTSRPSAAMRFFFVLGAGNLLYQNIGMLIYLLGSSQQKLQDEQLDLILQLSETGSIMGLTMVAACKMLLLFWHGDNIAQLIDAFQRIFPSEEMQRTQSAEKEREIKRQNKIDLGYYPVQHYALKSNKLMKMTAIFFMFAFCWYNSMPVLEWIIDLNSPVKRFRYHYQSNTWYPWQTEHNSKSIVLYMIAYLCQLHSSLTGVAFIMAGEFMLCFFITQMQLHFDFLSDALENLDAGGAQAEQQLKYLIDYHNMLLRFSTEINQIFNISFLVNFVTSTIAICLMGCSMVIMAETFNTFKFSVGLLSFLVFTLFICYNGSEFTSASDKLMHAALYNNWYEGSLSYRKMILFFIMRSVRPSVLRAHKFTDVSMQAYMVILQSSYKLFTFFRAMA